ncbi:hypothetical protein DBR32_06430 [Taibaiella sp. KBW10]|uniref:hypothetical protein n=1 Tax=Taibaiella sp. KBW10 TaxID=2153357 RepID=UPI000F5B6F06|nr:hypothetical protein [Taibaiella sp. KBW10]RQO31590.1 hypothetical protein DBR32_06430 [Taibaiella sp. KBW10]
MFKEYLQTFQPTGEVVDLFTHVLDDIFNTNDVDRRGRKKQVEAKIEDLKGRINTMDYKYADGGISDENYSRIIAKLNNDLNELVMQHATFAKASPDLNKYMNYSIGLLQNVSEYYASAAANTKHKLVGVIFPEKLTFKEKWYYTTKINELLMLILNSSFSD